MVYFLNEKVYYVKKCHACGPCAAANICIAVHGAVQCFYLSSASQFIIYLIFINNFSVL